MTTAAPETNASAYTNQSRSAGNDQFSHLPPLQQSIARFILQQPPTEEGIHVAAIARAIGIDGDAQRIRYDTQSSQLYYNSFDMQ